MDLIDRKELLKTVEDARSKADHLFADSILTLIDIAPTIDAEPIIHSRWHRTDYNDFHCMNCGNLVHEPKMFCDECGAKMDEE